MNVVVMFRSARAFTQMEQFKGYTFVILRAYTAAPNANIRSVGGLSSKISFFLKENQLITIHRSSFDF